MLEDTREVEHDYLAECVKRYKAQGGKIQKLKPQKGDGEKVRGKVVDSNLHAAFRQCSHVLNGTVIDEFL